MFNRPTGKPNSASRRRLSLIGIVRDDAGSGSAGRWSRRDPDAAATALKIDAGGTDPLSAPSFAASPVACAPGGQSASPEDYSFHRRQSSTGPSI